MTAPLKPHEVLSHKKANIPKEVFEVMNNFISLRWNGTEARVWIKELADAIADKLKIPLSEVGPKGYLELAPIYRHEGWTVVYWEPTGYDCGAPNLTFTQKPS